MKELRLSEIWIYPVKSLGGIRLDSAKVMEKGLLHDRRWMLIDENGSFMTQRQHPQMALFSVEINGDHMTITKRDSSQGNTAISFDTRTSQTGETIRSKVWDDPVDVIEFKPQLSHWFSHHLKLPCKLVSFPEGHIRPVNPKYSVNKEQVSLADAYPFMIIGQSSLDDLNTRLEQPLPMNRFRPNLVFTGGEPYEEDQWRGFSIGKTRFVGVKPCDRCVLTTVDQDTGKKGAEPLVTLAKYRKRDNKIYFGQNVVAIDHNEISVGDPITIG